MTKCLPCRREDRSLIPQKLCKNPAVEHVLVIPVLGSRNRLVLGIVGQLVQLLQLNFVAMGGRSDQKQLQEERKGLVYSSEGHSLSP